MKKFFYSIVGVSFFGFFPLTTPFDYWFIGGIEYFKLLFG